MEQLGSDDFEYEDDGFIIQDDGLLEVDSDEFDAVIEEELSKFHQQQADKYAQLQATSPWVAVPLASPDPITQQLRIEEHQQQAHLPDAPCEQERSEYIPPPRPPALQRHLDGPFTATEYLPAVQYRPTSAAAPTSALSADAFDSVDALQEGLTAVASEASSGMQLDEDAEPAAHHLSSFSSGHEAGNQQHGDATAAPAWEASSLHAEDPVVGECEYITEMPDDNPSPAAIEYDKESDTHKAARAVAVAAGSCEQQGSTEFSNADESDMPAAYIIEQQQAILQQSPAAAAGGAAPLQDGADSVDELPAVIDFAMEDAGPADAEPEVPLCPSEHAATTHLAQSAEGFFLENWQGCPADNAVLHGAAHQEQFELYAAGSIKQQEAGDLEAASISNACAVPEVTAATNMQPREPAASPHDEPAPVVAAWKNVQPPAEAAEQPAGAGSAAAVGGAAYTDPSSAAAAMVEQDAQHGEQEDWAEASEGSAAGQAAIEQQPSALQPEMQLDAAVHDAGDSELLPANVSTPESGLEAHLLEQDGQINHPAASANLQDDPAVSADLQEQQLQHESETSEQQVLQLEWNGQQHRQTQPDEGDQPASDATLPLVQPKQAEWPQPENPVQQLSEQQPEEQPYDGEGLSVSDSLPSADEGSTGQGGAGEQQEAYQQQAHDNDELLAQSGLEQELLLDVEQHPHQQEAADVLPRASSFEQQTPLSHTDAGEWMVLPGQGHPEHVQQYLGSSQEVEQACGWTQQQASTGKLNTHAAATAELQVPEQHESVGSGASDALHQHEQQHQQLGDEYGEQQGVGELPEQQFDVYRLSQQATLPTDTSAADTDAGGLHDQRQSVLERDHKAAAGILIAQNDPVLPSGQQNGEEQQEESKKSAAFEYQQQAGGQQTEDLTPVQQQQRQTDKESDHHATAEHGSFTHHHDIDTDEVCHSVHTGNSTVTPAASTAAPAALHAAEIVLDKGPEDAAAADADDGFIYQDEDPHSSNCSSSRDSPVETAAEIGLGIRPLAAAAGLPYTRVSSSADDRGQGEYTGPAAAIDWYPRLSQQNAGQEHIISWPDGAAISPPTAAAAGAARSAALSPQPPPHAPHHGTRPVHSKTRPAVGSPSPDMMARYDGQLFTATAAPVVGRLRPESAPARRALTPTKRHSSPMTQIRGLTLAEGHSKPAWVTGGACASQQQLAQAVHVYGQQAAAWGITVNSGMQLPSRPHTSHGYINSARSTSLSRKAGWTQPAGFAARPGSHAWTAEAGNSSSSSGRHLVRPVSADSASRAAEGQLSARQQQQQQWQDGRLQQQQRAPSRSPPSTSRTSTPRQCYDEIRSLSQAYGFKPRNLDAGDGACSSDWQQQRWQNTAQQRTIPWDNSPVPLNTPNSMPIAAATQSYDVLLAAKAGTGKSAGHSALCSTAAGHSALLARPRTAGSAEAGSILREHPGFTPRVGRGSPSASVRGSSGSGSEVYLADLLQKIRQANNSCRKMDMRKVYRLGKGSSVTWQQQQIVVEVWGLMEDQETEQNQLYSWQLKGCLTLQQFDKQCEKIAAKVLEIEAAAAVAGAQEVLVVDSTSGSSGSSPDWVRPDTHAAAAGAGPTARQAWPAATDGAGGTVHRSQSGVRPQSARPSSASRGGGSRQQQQQAQVGSIGGWQESELMSWGAGVRSVTGATPNAVPAWQGDYL